jgi:3-oxoacyl-[acyl-carrier protein] reductase
MSRVALVVGGTKGIGLACARALLADGCRVAVTTRATPAPDDLEAFVVTCDVTVPEQIDAAFDAVEAELGNVEILVVSAGTTRDGLLLRMKDEDITGVLETNLLPAFRATRRAARSMVRSRWGRVVLIGSVVGTLGQAGQANYAASKAGLVGFARSTARELASRNITVNVVSPGPIETDLLAAAGDAQVEALRSHVPVGRLGTPDEVAAAVRYLASDAAAYVTGSVLPVDGGLGMGG